MKQLLRAYITNLGIPAAWFRNLIYEFCDKNNTPLDTVIVADNQGGKTTSLSFMLNTLHPREDRFIQTLNPENNHKFDQYLDTHYNQPGIVVLEFDIGEAPGQARLPSIAFPKKHFLAGQFIVIDSQGNKYRRFFSMRCAKGVSLKKLVDGSSPCEGFALKDLKNLNDVKEWISGMRDRFQGRGDAELAVADFTLMDSQAAWTNHLLDQFGIDPELVALQVDMNGREGAAADAQMFKFRDEKDFLQKFIRFCLNRDEAENTIKAVRAGLDKIQDIPRYERQLLALQALQNNMKPFTDAAEELAMATKSLRRVKETGLGLKREIDQALKNARETVEYLESQEKDVAANSYRAQEEKRNTENHIRGLHDFLNGVKLRDLAAKYETEKAKLEDMRYQASLFRARQDLDLIRIDESRLKQNEALLREEQLNANDLEIATKNAGRDYLASINTNLRLTDIALSDIKAAIAAIDGELTTLEFEEEKCRIELSKFQIKETKLEVWFETKRKELTRLEEDEVLADGEGIETALNRLRLDIVTNTKEFSVLQEKKNTIEQEIDNLRNNRMPDINKQILKIEVAIKHQEQSLSEEKEISHDLCSQAKNIGLSDTMDIDLDSKSLLSDLIERRGRAETNIACLYIKKDSLTQDKRCIETFGIRGIDPEVLKVVDAAHICGVDAQPFSHWLAKQFPDKPEEARRVYLADTTRASGVLIHSREQLERLNATEKFHSQLQLERSVALSLPSIELFPARQFQVILGPKDDSLYNEISASECLEKVGEDIAVIDVEISSLRNSLEAMDNFNVIYGRWVKEFGNGKKQSLENKYNANKNEFLKFKANIEGLIQNIREAEQRLNDVQKAQQIQEAFLNKLQSNTDVLLRYKETFEDLAEVKAEEFASTTSAIKNVNAAIEEYKNAKKRLKATTQTHYDALKPHLERRGELIQQKSNVIMFSEPEQNATPSAPLGELEAMYATYHEQYKLALSDKVSNLKGVCEEIQKSLNQKKSSYINKYAQLVDSEVQSIDGNNLSTKIESLRPQIDALASEVSRIARDRDAAEIKQNMKREEWRERQENYWGPEDMNPETTTVQEIEAKLKVQEESSRRISEEIERFQNDSDKLKKQAKTLSDPIGALEVATSKLEDLEEEGNTPQSFELTINVFSFDKAILETLVKDNLKIIRQAKTREEKARGRANDAHSDFLRSLEDDFIKEHAQQERAIMAANGHGNFNAFCEQAGDIRNHLDERMEAIQQQINDKESDIEICAKQLGHLVESGISLLRKATKIKVPSSVARIGDQPIIKLVQAHLDPQAPLFDLMKERIRSMASESSIPLSGQQLVADIIWNITHERGRGLNIKLLKPEPGNIGFNHYGINSLSSCGGEMLTIALMLYMVNARLRAEAHGRHLGKCGSLFLDNPFGKANKPWLVEIQRSLASALGIQLIYLSGIKDINTLFKFGHHLHLRLAGSKDKNTGRQIVETVRLEINEHAVA